MSLNKEWFTERVGKTIIRTNTYDNSETEWEVTEQNAGYLWLFTEKGYTYREAKGEDDWLKAAVPKIRLHKAMNPDGTNSKMCTFACEG